MDERGWEILIFAGHSNETELTGGKFKLTPDVIVSISEIEEELIKAKEWGLQVAIFNSCSGLSIAKALIQLGLSQVVVMREKSHDNFNPVFLEKLCQSLAQYNDLQQAVQDARNYLESQKKAFPSAYLIPSLFRHPDPEAELFRIERLGWWRDWQPSRTQVIALSIFVLLSLMVPVQHTLLDLRILFQTFARQLTKQLPTEPLPPVHIISVDQESINRARAERPNFVDDPIDREYLEDLVTHLSQLGARVIGMSYVLDEPAAPEKEEKLAQAVASAVTKKNVWFVFSKGKGIDLDVNIFNPQLSLEGNNNIRFWKMDLPEDLNCYSLCPFSYFLSLSHKMNTIKEATRPNSSSPDLLNQRLSSYVDNEKTNLNHIHWSNQANILWGTHYTIDFSLPPEQVYQTTPAWNFLGQDLSNTELKEKLKQQVVIIAPFNYDRRFSVHYPAPLAVEYWCRFNRSQDGKERDCERRFTAGEAHAYRVHHWLQLQRPLLVIHNIWMIGIAIILGKLTTIILLKQKYETRKKWALHLSIAVPCGFGILGLAAYIFASVLIPLGLPLATFLIYSLSILRRKNYG